MIRAGGLLGILAGFGKSGKTTFAHRLINSIARGKPFLGRATVETKTLILAVEDPRESVEENSLELLDGGHPNILYHAAPLTIMNDSLKDIVRCIKSENIGLVDLETLSSFWNVKDENDNAQVQRQVALLRNAARESDVPWLIHAHTGKNKNLHDGAEIRGASSLFGAVDFALIFGRKGRGRTTKRQLYGLGRLGNVSPFVFDFDPKTKTYELLETEAGWDADETARKVAAALRGDWERTSVIGHRCGLQSDLSLVGSTLRKLDGVECQGRGVKGDPYFWRRRTS